MTIQRTLRLLPVLSVLVPASLTLPTTGWSQVEEIVVTARRREESLQDVPLAITAFSEENIERRGIDELEDIIKYTPGVTLDEGFSEQDQRVVIRGLSPTRGRPNVAFLQDDVDISSESIQTSGSSLFINPRLFDLERIEVVKGPQSALYGRAAFGGAIHYITKKPGDVVEGRVGLDVGSDGQQELTASLSGPIAEDLFSAGINFANWSHDGFYNNTITGAPVGDTEGYGIALSAVLTPSDNFKATARVEFTDDEFGQQAMAESSGTATLPVPASAIAGGVITPFLPFVTIPAGPAPDVDELVIRHTPNPRTGTDLRGVDRELIRGQLRLDYTTDWAEFSSITHVSIGDTFQEIDSQRIGDNDLNQFGGHFRIDQENTLISQEFRLTSQSDGPWSWVVGTLIWNEDSEVVDRNTTCLVLIPLPGLGSCGDYFRAEGLRSPGKITDRQTEHLSVYGLLEWEINDRWTAHIEGRFASEDLTLVGPTFGSTLGFFNPGIGPITSLGPPPFPPGQPLTVSGEEDDDFFAPKFFLEYEPNDDMNFYFSVARAVKPAGISPLTAGPTGFDPDANRFEAEELTAYEFGAKTLWADGTFQLNASVFFQDYDEKQTNTQVVVGGFLAARPVNASAAEIFGVEFDAVWAPNENWTLALSYSYLDTEYTDFRILSRGVGPITSAGNCTALIPPGAMDTTPTCQIDLSGRPIEDVPENSLFASVSYERPLNGDTDWFVQFDANYVDDREESPETLVTFEDYWLADLRLGLSSDTWDITLYVDNVFDDDTVKTGFLGPDFRTFTFVPFPPMGPGPPVFTTVLLNTGFYKLPDPRTYGLRASFRFGD